MLTADTDGREERSTGSHLLVAAEPFQITHIAACHAGIVIRPCSDYRRTSIIAPCPGRPIRNRGSHKRA